MTKPARCLRCAWFLLETQDDDWRCTLCGNVMYSSPTLPYEGQLDARGALSAGKQPHSNELTPEERDVAELLCSALTYAEIGARLGCTPKAVEDRVRRVGQKAGGIRGRAAVGEWWQEISEGVGA